MSSRDQNACWPTFSAAEARELALEHYGFEAAEVDRFPSYYDQNFLLRDRLEQKRVLKIANSAHEAQILELQNQAMDRLAAGGLGSCQVCRVQPSQNGGRIIQVRQGSHLHHIRLLSYVEGQPWSEAAYYSPALWINLGRLVARVYLALKGFTHSQMHSFREWDLMHSLRLSSHVDKLATLQQRQIVGDILKRFSMFVEPCLTKLPTSVIHGDINNDNVLVEGSEVVGLIDFGDVGQSASVCELAIAMAYAMLGNEDPVAVGEFVLQGYQQIQPLSEPEHEVVFDLAWTRLAASVTYAAHYRILNPNNDDYTATNESAAWKVLKQIADRA